MTTRTSPKELDVVSWGHFDVIIDIAKNAQKDELTNEYTIRRRTVDFGIPLITNIQLAQRFVEAFARKQPRGLHAKPWREYTGALA